MSDNPPRSSYTGVCTTAFLPRTASSAPPRPLTTRQAVPSDVVPGIVASRMPEWTGPGGGWETEDLLRLDE